VKTDERTSLDREDDAPGVEKRRNPILRFLGELPGLIFMAFVLALLIKTFLVQAFYIPSPSMVPTLKVGDRVLVTKIPYYFHDPERGDVIVFEDPTGKAEPDRSAIGGILHWMFQGLGVQKPDNEDFIKRVIGLPGDTVWAKDGKVYVNGAAIDESGYLTQRTADFDKVHVPDDMLFVLGDNRSNSQDSRLGLGVNPTNQPGVGFIPIDDVIGKAFLIVWPPGDFGGIAA
jgi:signal peptidase I